MVAVTELGYVVLGVKDLAQWREFASGILGLEAFDEGESGTAYLRMDYWHHRFILKEDPADDLKVLGLRVGGADEFGELRKHLQASGVVVEVASREQTIERRVLEVMRLSDPAGNPIEIFHGPLVQPEKPFHPGRRMHGRYVTADGGVGHCILRNAGLDAAYRFYKLLGMRGGIEYRIPQPNGNPLEILFMHCNSRDHTVAFGPPSTKHINHLMLEFDNLDDVELTYEIVARNKLPVAISPGKHANDRMYSFYFMNPSNWMCEIGWGGRHATHQSEYYERDIYGHQFRAGVGRGMSVE